MQRKKKNKQVYRIGQAGFAFALLLLLCGCTRKEELLILTEETAEDMSASRNAGGETSGAGDSGYVTETETVGALAGENGRVSSGESRYVTTGQGSGALSGDGAREEAEAAGEHETASAEGKPQEGAPEKSGILQDGTTEGFGILGGSSLGGQSSGESKATGTAADGRININTASEAQL